MRLAMIYWCYFLGVSPRKTKDWLRLPVQERERVLDWLAETGTKKAEELSASGKLSWPRESRVRAWAKQNGLWS